MLYFLILFFSFRFPIMANGYVYSSLVESSDSHLAKIRKHLRKGPSELLQRVPPSDGPLIDCDQILSQASWEKKEEIGEGFFSKVFNLCKGEDCSYILKRVLIQNEETRKQALNEFITYHHLQRNQINGISPQSYDIHICTSEGELSFQFILEKYDGTLNDYMKTKLRLSEEEKKIIQKLLKNTHKTLIHGDIHDRNILYKKQSDGSITFRFSDFGNSHLKIDKRYPISFNHFKRGRVSIKTFEDGVTFDKKGLKKIFRSYRPKKAQSPMEILLKKGKGSLPTDIEDLHEKIIELEDKLEYHHSNTPLSNVRALVAKGRSLHRDETDIKHPRVIFGLGSEIFTGYSEKANQVEIIAWNPKKREYDFFVVENFHDPKKQKVEKIPKKDGVCFSCHQDHGPIWANFPWRESNVGSDPRVKYQYFEQMKTAHPSKSYKGVAINIIGSSKIALDIDVAVRDGSKRLQMVQVCNHCQDLSCRLMMLSYFLSKEYQFDKKREVDFFDRRIQSHWPQDGFSTASSHLPDRDPYGDQEKYYTLRRGKDDKNETYSKGSVKSIAKEQEHIIDPQNDLSSPLRERPKENGLYGENALSFILEAIPSCLFPNFTKKEYNLVINLLNRFEHKEELVDFLEKDEKIKSYLSQEWPPQAQGFLNAIDSSLKEATCSPQIPQGPSLIHQENDFSQVVLELGNSPAKLLRKNCQKCHQGKMPLPFDDIDHLKEEKAKDPQLRKEIENIIASMTTGIEKKGRLIKMPPNASGIPEWEKERESILNYLSDLL